MDIPLEEDLPNLHPAAIAGRLMAAGTALRGRNLRKTSWLEIAEGLQQTGVARVALPRLAAAVTREDAIRVLRIVRKHRRPGRAPHRAAGRSRIKSRVATKNEVSDEYYDALWGGCGVDSDATDSGPLFFWNRSTFDYQAWQAWDLLIQGTGDPRLSDGLPASLWEAMKSVACNLPTATSAAAAEPAGAERRAVRATEVFALLRSILRGDPAGSTGSTGTESRAVPGITDADRQALAVLIIAHSDSGSGRCEGRLEDHTALIMMLMLSPLWVRRPSTWHAPDAERRARVRSLADHLFVQYPVPAAMYLAWDLVEPWNNIVWSWKAVVCFILLGQGFNLRRVGRQFGWRFPKGFVECLWKLPPCNDLWSAFLMAEVMRVRGSPVEYRRVRRHAMFRTDFTGNPGLFPDEHGEDQGFADPYAADHHREEIRFLDDVIAWLARYRDDLTDEMCGRVLDWAEHMHNQFPERFSLVSRLPRAVLDAALAHAELIKNDQRPELSWQLSGWNWEAVLPSGDWAIRELVSTTELITEGNAMCHCVGEYDSKCVQGVSAIFSMTEQGNRTLTIEVALQNLTIVQVRGEFNRLPTQEERAVIQRWYEDKVTPAHLAHRHGGLNRLA